MSPDEQVTALDSKESLEAIRDAIFSLPLLPQKQVLELFSMLDESLRNGVDLLLHRCNFVEQYLADVISEVAASVTHGRTIYETHANRGEERELTGVYKKRSDIRFLENSVDIIHMLAAYRPDNSEALKQHTRKMLNEIKFARLVYEDALSQFIQYTEGYETYAAEAARLHHQLHNPQKRDSAARLMNQYAELHDKMFEMETAVGVERAYLYHCCRTIRRYNRRQQKLRDIIYQPYLRIVYKEARKHATNNQQVLDNLQNGAQGLLRGISCYNVNKRVSFSSYAHWWIRQAILFHIKESSNFMKLPVTTWQTFTSAEKKRAALASQTGDDDLESLADETGHTIEKLKTVYDSVRSSHVHSLDYEVDESGKMMLIDVIADPTVPEREHDNAVREEVRERLACLPDEQRIMMLLHHGIVDMLEDSAPMTLRDVLRERVRQRLAGAL
jgi:RNA polymerase sigma factor (sigma-70 family)